MNRKQLLALGLLGVGSLVFMNKSKDKYSKEDLDKIKKYKKYLIDKDFVIVTKKDYNKMSKSGNKLLSLSSLHTYYAVAKSVARYVL